MNVSFSLNLYTLVSRQNSLIILIISSLTFGSGHLHSWIKTCLLMQKGVQSKIKNRMTNSVYPDDKAVSSGSILFAQVSVLICRAEKIILKEYKHGKY